ncbi:MAG: hypothetical protein ACFB5Z_01185 [Elainellaceae cyanobacterium]
MKRVLTPAEVSLVVLKLVIAGFYPEQHFVLTERGQVLACPQARAFLQKASAWKDPAKSRS